MIFLGKNSIIDLITAVILSTIPFLIRPNQEKTIYARLEKFDVVLYYSWNSKRNMYNIILFGS